METNTTTTSSMDYEKGIPPPPPPPPPAGEWRLSGWDALLRLLLLAASVVVVVLVTTSKETTEFMIPGIPILIIKPAKFNYSPAFTYLVAAFGVAILYSLITGLASLCVVRKPNVPAKWLLILIALDVLMLGILASATGTAGGVAYIGLKGNSHVLWLKICDRYGKFCRHVGSAVAVALFASFLLVLLVISNAWSLYRRVEPRS